MDFMKILGEIKAKFENQHSKTPIVIIKDHPVLAELYKQSKAFKKDMAEKEAKLEAEAKAFRESYWEKVGHYLETNNLLTAKEIEHCPLEIKDGVLYKEECNHTDKCETVED